MVKLDALTPKFSGFDLHVSDIEPCLPDLPEDSSLLLGGTFNEGLATPTSDVDFLLVLPEYYHIEGLTSRSGGYKSIYNPVREGDSSFPNDNMLVVNRTSAEKKKIQIYVVREDYLKKAQDAVLARNDSYRRRLAGDPAALQRKGRMLDWTGQILLHRLYTGLPLHNVNFINSVVSRLSLNEISDNVGVRESSWIQGYFSDIDGLHLSGRPDDDTVIYIGHRIFVHLAGLLLASVNEVSPQEKLLFRLLKRHRERIGGAVVDDLFNAYASVPALSKSGPKAIEERVIGILQQSTTLSELVSREFDDWTREATYSPSSFSAA